MKQIYFFCPDDNQPCGGVRKMYKQVDVLNEAGFQAFILHQKQDFRCTWFENKTPITYTIGHGQMVTDSLNYLVLPEIFGRNMATLARGVKKVIFNQNSYFTFRYYNFDKNDLATPYMDSEVVAAMVVSEDNRAYLQHAFPKLPIERIHYGIDEKLFYYNEVKKPQIAFMPRKNSEELLQVINILKFRGLLKDFDLMIVHNLSEKEVAKVLRESLIFLSFGYPEGSPLPPKEAMACGCIVIGYHGMGGREYFKEEFSYPVPLGDVLAFAKTVENVVQLHRKTPELLVQKAKEASNFIRKNFSSEREKADILTFWGNLTKSHG